jgi:hypothetical protein
MKKTGKARAEALKQLTTASDISSEATFQKFLME